VSDTLHVIRRLWPRKHCRWFATWPDSGGPWIIKFTDQKLTLAGGSVPCSYHPRGDPSRPAVGRKPPEQKPQKKDNTRSGKPQKKKGRGCIVM
jgi:hypothetical protein